MDPPSTERDRTLTGILYALAAFGTWGLVAPVHFKLLAAVPALEVLAQRIVWSALLVLAIIAARRRWPPLLAALRARRPLGMLAISAVLVGANWLVYIWAVSSGQLVEASLGYFINPLVNVALGILFLGERLRPLQVAACGLASVGVLVLTVAAGTVPWIALALGISFGFYGLIRKTVRVDPLIGFCVELLLLLPFARLCRRPDGDRRERVPQGRLAARLSPRRDERDHLGAADLVCRRGAAPQALDGGPPAIPRAVLPSRARRRRLRRALHGRGRCLRGDLDGARALFGGCVPPRETGGTASEGGARRNNRETSGAISPKQNRPKRRARTRELPMRRFFELAASAAAALGGFALAFLINPYLPL